MKDYPIFYINHINELETFDVKSRKVNFVFKFIDKEEQNVELLMKSLISLKEKGYQIIFSINVEDYNPDDDDIMFYMSLNKALEKENILLKFSGGYKSDYALDELLKADTVLDNFIKELKDESLSPFEKYLLIYTYLAKKKYKAEEDSSIDAHLSRDLIAVMNSDYIVCEGYANLMEYLCNNVGIWCIEQGVKIVESEEKFEKHKNNLVKIDDDKYNIHGLYYSDVTWDSGFARGNSFSLCLIPIDDVFRIKSYIIPEHFYLIFYQYSGTLVRLLDPYFFDAIGNIVSYNKPFHYEYREGRFESLFHMQKEVKKSYREAIDSYIEKRHHVLAILKDLMIKKAVPFDAYSTSDYRVPYGCSLSALIAALVASEDNIEYVEGKIDLLLSHLQTPADKKGQRYQFEELPIYINPHLYKTLDILDKMPDEEINIPYRELCKRKVDPPATKNDFFKNFDDVMLERRKYENLALIIDNIRLIDLYDGAEEYVKKEFPLGEPIPVETFRKALVEMYKHQGSHELVATAKANEAINITKGFAERIFEDKAINNFYKEAAKKDAQQ